MKTKIYSLLVALMSVVAFTACDDWTPGTQGTYAENTGGVSRSNMKVSVNETEASIGRAGVDTSGFLVTITDKTTGSVASYEGKTCSWTYSQMPPIFTLPVGTYIVTVRSHEPEKTAWNTPYYVGSSEFEVKNNEVTYIGTVTCNFAAVKVELRYSKEFTDKMDPSWSVVVNAGPTGNSLTWGPTETRYGYFIIEENNPTITATITGKTAKGQSVTETKTVSDAKSGNYYIFTFSVASGSTVLPDEFGQITQDPDPATSGITIDYDVIETPVDTTLKPGYDPIDDPDKQHPDKEEWPETPVTPVDPVDPNNPDDPNTGDESGVEMTMSPGLKADEINDIVDGQDYVINFKTASPITDMIVTIDSPYLTEDFLADVGMVTEFNLANPPEDLADTLGEDGFGLKIRDDVKGQTEVPFDLTGLIPLLNADPASDVHNFILTIKTEGKPDFVQTLKFRNLK